MLSAKPSGEEREREQTRRLWARAASLADRWRLVLGTPYRAGPVSLVVPVCRADGTAAVLKVPTLDDENRTEAEALDLYAGDGAVRLYDADPDGGGLLLERLEPGTPLDAHPDRAEAIDLICGLLRRLRRAVGPAHPFPTVRGLASRWAEELGALGAGDAHPALRAPVEEAAATAAGLALPGGDELLVNRDAHLGNVLAARREPWLLIDPKPLVGERAFDGGWLLLELLGPDGTPAAARELLARLSDGLGADPERIRRWAFVRAVETAVWLVSLGDDPGGDLATAATLARIA